VTQRWPNTAVNSCKALNTNIRAVRKKPYPLNPISTASLLPPHYHHLTTTATTVTTTMSTPAPAPAPASIPAPALASGSGSGSCYSTAPMLVNGLPLTKNTTAIQALSALPVVCQAILRPGKAFKMGRPWNEEAWLGQERGTEQTGTNQCSHCTRVFGTLTTCITVMGQFGPSCANCHYKSEGSRCSIRQSKIVTALFDLK